MKLAFRSGIVKGREIKKNRDGKIDKILLQVQITDVADVQTVEYFPQNGSDNNPIDESRVLILSIGESWKIAFAADPNQAAASNPGDNNFFSLDVDGNPIASLKLLNDGNIQINGENDNAVRFSDLKAAIDGLVNGINAETLKIQTAITGVGGSYTRAAVAGDIAAAKVETVLLPNAAEEI